MKNNLLTVRELAEVIGCDNNTIYSYTLKGLRYKEVFVKGEQNTTNRSIKMFSKRKSLEWIRANARSKYSNIADEIINTTYNKAEYEKATGIKKAAKDLGLKLSDIAIMLGVSKSAISKWIAGDRPIPENRLEMLMDILKSDKDELYS